MAKKVETGPQPKMPSALSHGAYSTIAILPGEDPQQLVDLTTELFAELQPFGRMEEETVGAIAGLFWRRRRIERSLSAGTILSKMNPTHPSYDEALHQASQLQADLRLLEDNPEYAEKLLAGFTITLQAHFQAKYPPKNYESAAARGAAMCEELKTKVLEHLKLLEPVISHANEGLYPANLAASANVLQEDLFKKELELLERIDAMIDRLYKRFYNVKSMKPALVSPLLANHVPQHKKLPINQAAPPQC